MWRLLGKLLQERSAVQMEFYQTMFPKPSKFEKEDPYFEDPIHTKAKVKCSISNEKQKIFCVENTGKKFDLNITADKPRPYWEDRDWNFIKEWNEYRGVNDEVGQNVTVFQPNIAGFIGFSDKKLTSPMVNNSNEADNGHPPNEEIISENGKVEIDEINEFFDAMEKKRKKEQNL